MKKCILAVALIDNMDDFYVTTKDLWGGGTELHYDRVWANEAVGSDIRDGALETVANVGTGICQN